MNQNLAKKGQKKTITFHILQNTGSLKKTVLLQLVFFCFFVLFNLFFLKLKTLMLNKKHNLKSGKSKDKKGIWNRKARQETKRKRTYFRKKRNCNWKCSCCGFSWNKSKEERKMKKRQKQETKRKQRRKTRRKKERQEKERETEKEKQKKGEAKKG